MYRPVRKKGRSEKLLFCYHGPFKIVKRINSLNYVVESLYGSKKRRDCVHVSKLKTFVGRGAALGNVETRKDHIKLRGEGQLQDTCG